MKRNQLRTIFVFGLLCAAFVFTSCVSTRTENTITLNYSFLSAEQCAQKLGEIDYYYDSLSQKSLDYLCQKKGATKEEYREFSMMQARDIPFEDMVYLNKVIAQISKDLCENGMHLPAKNDFSIAFTTMNEALGAGGYTHDTTIFLNKDFIESFINTNSKQKFLFLESILVHELFHTLTRNNPDFKADMYKIINFKINETDFVIPQNIHDLMIANPDVGHHNSYAEFTINGEKKNCYLVFLTKKEFQKPGDMFFSTAYSGLVSVEDGTLYTQDDAEDFYDVMGHNTDYCEDPEECLADNFSYAITYGMKGPYGLGYKSPEIIQKIIDYMKN